MDKKKCSVPLDVEERGTRHESKAFRAWIKMLLNKDYVVVDFEDEK